MPLKKEKCENKVTIVFNNTNFNIYKQIANNTNFNIHIQTTNNTTSNIHMQTTNNELEEMSHGFGMYVTIQNNIKITVFSILK